MNGNEVDITESMQVMGCLRIPNNYSVLGKLPHFVNTFVHTENPNFKNLWPFLRMKLQSFLFLTILLIELLLLKLLPIMYQLYKNTTQIVEKK